MKRHRIRRPFRKAVPYNILKEEPAEGQDLRKEEIQPNVTPMELNAEISPDLPKKRLRKGERGHEMQSKRRRLETSKSAKHGASLNAASKRPGSFKLESRANKRRGEMGKRADDGSSMSANTDNESGTTPAETPIIVTGLESFTFHKILGQGGFGKVMLATHPACQQHLAVKMVKKRQLLQYFRSNVLIERQVLEVTAKSPLFTRAYATFHSKDYAFFIMEFLNGGDLSHVMRANAPFPIPVIRFFAAEIICGLQFLHSRGIIHRDIKPENILLDSAGHLKIADFGLAVMNIFGDKKISQYAGTARYMAPEILLEKPYNTAVDWYSAGVVFYEMATGKYPFYTGALIGKIAKSLINDVPTYPKGFDNQARDMIEGLLNKSPESRQVAARNIREHPFFMDINWTDVEGARACSPLKLITPPVMTSKTMVNVLSSTEANKPSMADRDQKLFCGFTFDNDRWQVIKPIKEPVIRHRRTFGRIVREAFREIWSRIKCW